MTKKIILFVIMLVFFSVLVSNNASACFCVVDTLPGAEYCAGGDCTPGASCPSCSSDDGNDKEKCTWYRCSGESCILDTYETAYGCTKTDQCRSNSECCVCDECRCFLWWCNCQDITRTGSACPCTDKCYLDPRCGGTTPTTTTTPPTTTTSGSNPITTTPPTTHTTVYIPPTTVDPCAGVNCGSCRYCSGGSCYNYCSGTSSSCGCTSCTNCGSCAYCSGTSCSNYCSGTDTSCGCTSCTNCNTLDNWYNKGSTYPCCDLTDPDTICTCQDQEYRNYYCSGTSCTYSITNTQTVRSGCNNCGYCKTCSSGSCIDKPGVKGTVTDAFENPIEDAEIKILGLDKSITTDANGNYFICEFPQGIYDIVASKKGFDPVNKQFDFDGIEVVPVNFILYTAGSDCRPDCSKTNDEIPVCHMDCEGINGCRFYDDTLMNICTRKGEMIGVPVGNTVSYNETYKARCCEGSPYLYKKTPGTSLVFPEAENIVRITRIVFFRGQFARMIIDVFK